MAGKQAKIFSEQQVEDLLFFAKTTRNPNRNRVIVLLSTKAGLRAAEFANLNWEMVVEPTGNVSSHIELRDHAAKMGSGRTFPINALLHEALVAWRTKNQGHGPVVTSERGGKMTALSIVIWFARAYEALGLEGCLSHSGRRTFVTRQRDWFTKPAAHCVMSNCSPVTDQSRPHKATSTGTATHRGGWYR